MSLPVEESDAPADEWLSARAAAGVAGLPEKKIPLAAALGYLTVKKPLPGLGGIVKYGKASCLALASRMVTPARVGPDSPASSIQESRRP